MQPTVAVLGSVRFPSDNLPKVLPHLEALVDATRANDGCIAYDVAADPFDPGLIRFSELWPNHDTLARHLQAAHIEPWRAAARKYGMTDRQFTAYDVAGAKAV